MYDEAIRINKNDTESYFNKGLKSKYKLKALALTELKSFDEAIEIYNFLIQINPY